MSLSCHKSGCGWSAAPWAVVLGVTGVLSSGVSSAAQTYVVPSVVFRVEHHDNYRLVPGGNPDSSIIGYIADAQALIGIDTPRSQTSIRPRLKLQEYPDLNDLDDNQRVTPVEGFLDVVSQYTLQRGEFGIIGRYARQDSYNAETPGGSFDPLDPSFGDNPDSGRARVEQTRDRFQLQPTFSYEVTERARIGIAADYQMVRYDSDGVPTDLDYDYAVLDGSATWSLNSVSDLTVGAYASNYQAMTDSVGDVSETDAYGGRVGYVYRWSDVNGVEAELFYENNDVTDLVGERSEFSTSGWGGSLIAYHRQEVSEWRFSVGRTFQPTSDGRKAEFDQFRLQYDRDLSQRLKFLGAARYETRSSIASNVLSNDRDYARIDLSLEWMVTPRWFVGGGYSYLWEDRIQAPESAEDNRFFLAAGFRGLKPAR